MSSPHVYKFAIHQELLSEGRFLFEEFNTRIVDCCCFPVRRAWSSEYSFSDLPPLLNTLKSYVYYQLDSAGFQIRDSGKMTFYEYNSNNYFNHVAVSKSLFYTPGFPQVHAVLIFTKDGIYDSGLIHKRRTHLKHVYLKHFSIEEEVKTDLPEGMGVMYHKDNYMEFVGGCGLLQMICFSFDQK